MADVRRAAAEFAAKHDRLDVLVNNAGATFKAPTMSPDGFELTFALNHLAYSQLATSLLALLRKTPGARVVSTSSAMQARGKLDLAKTPTSDLAPGLGAEGIRDLQARERLVHERASATSRGNVGRGQLLRTGDGADAVRRLRV